MKMLYDEIIRRFPEVQSKIHSGDEELPYQLMHYVVEWLQEFRSDALTPDVIQRVQDFSQWCEDQPRGEQAKDDVFTILAVGFWESLFESDSTRTLVPRLMSRADVQANSEYLKGWVGSDNYEKTLREFDPPA
jgi:hypothetical protein